MMPYELPLVSAQFNGGAGIFACNGHAVYSAGTKRIGEGGPWCPTGTTAVDVGPPARVGSRSVPGQSTNSWLNTANFIQVWDSLTSAGTFRGYDWTVKIDPDTVFFPSRLRQHLPALAGGVPGSNYVLNCDQWGGKLFGAIEVLSRLAVEAYAARHGDCTQNLQWEGMGEDYYIRQCMDMLGVGHLSDFTLLSDSRGHCTKVPGPPCAIGNVTVAFHPIKSADGYDACLQQAGAAAPSR